MNATAVIDTADILLAQPITVAPGETIDFSGTALSVDFTPIRGGAPVMSASTADGTIAFVGGAVSVTIPAGIFTALPVVSHSIQSAGTRDYVLRISGLALNADKTVTLTGVVRQSRMLPGTLLISGGNETFETLATAVTLHLVAVESD